MSEANVVIELVEGKAGRAAFVDTGRDFAAREPHWVPQLRSEQLELVNPEKNPFFGHAAHQLFVARRGDAVVGRISAHIDRLALELPRQQGFGPGAGMFGYFDAADETVAHALLRALTPALQALGARAALDQRVHATCSRRVHAAHKGGDHRRSARLRRARDVWW